MRRSARTAAAPAAVAIAAVIIVAVMGGCSSDSTSTASSAPDPTASPTASTSPTTATTRPVTIDSTVAPTSTPTSTTATPTTTSPPALAGPLTVQQLLDLGRPIVLAHAGGEDEYPHSTPYVYAESAAAGVDVLDFDVQLTADGVLVVQHDDNVDRTTNGTGNVAEMTYAQLAELDNAYWFTAACTCRDQPPDVYIYRGVRTGETPPPAGYTPDDFIIPRFRDIAERFPDLPVNIEIKPTGEAGVATAKQLAAELTELDLLDNAVVASFDDTIVDTFHQFAPTVEVTPGLNASSAFILNGTPLPAGMRILQVPVDFGDIKVLTPESIGASHAAGYVIWVWPNDHAWENAEGYATLLGMGLDGLNINYPRVGVDAVEAFDAG